MSDHYYTADPNAAHDIRLHEVEILSQSMRFYTDSGVFSKSGLDDGSAIFLRALPALSGRVLDLGCGWGAIGLTLAKVYPEAQFVLADVNERAVSLCEKNRLENRITNAQIITSDGFSKIDGEFDFLLTNPPIRAGKSVIYRFFEQGYHRLRVQGSLCIVIRKQQGAASAQKFMQSFPGAHVSMLDREKGYWVINCTKGDIDHDE